jgi:hypothetical protein
MLQRRYCPNCKQYQRTKPDGLVCLACEPKDPQSR